MKQVDRQKARKRTLLLMKKNWLLYVFLIPAVVYIAEIGRAHV